MPDKKHKQNLSENISVTEKFRTVFVLTTEMFTKFNRLKNVFTLAESDSYDIWNLSFIHGLRPHQVNFGSGNPEFCSGTKDRAKFLKKSMPEWIKEEDTKNVKKLILLLIL